MDTDAKQLVESLRPSRHGAVMDLVAEAGVDVSKWSVNKDGKPVAKWWPYVPTIIDRHIFRKSGKRFKIR